MFGQLALDVRNCIFAFFLPFNTPFGIEALMFFIPNLEVF